MQKNTSIPQSGALIVPMTNDYLFRALLQRNNLVLKGLICALLHMKEADISSVIITNVNTDDLEHSARSFRADLPLV